MFKPLLVALTFALLAVPATAQTAPIACQSRVTASGLGSTYVSGLCDMAKAQAYERFQSQNTSLAARCASSGGVLQPDAPLVMFDGCVRSPTGWNGWGDTFSFVIEQSYLCECRDRITAAFQDQWFDARSGAWNAREELRQGGLRRDLPVIAPTCEEAQEVAKQVAEGYAAGLVGARERQRETNPDLPPLNIDDPEIGECRDITRVNVDGETEKAVAVDVTVKPAEAKR